MNVGQNACFFIHFFLHNYCESRWIFFFSRDFYFSRICSGQTSSSWSRRVAAAVICVYVSCKRKKTQVGREMVSFHHHDGSFSKDDITVDCVITSSSFLLWTRILYLICDRVLNGSLALFGSLLGFLKINSLEREYMRIFRDNINNFLYPGEYWVWITMSLELRRLISSQNYISKKGSSCAFMSFQIKNKLPLKSIFFHFSS